MDRLERMRLEYTQNLKLEQRLAQSPQMIQAMQILQLTTPELLDRIEAELEDNPFLEADGLPTEGEAAESDEREADEDLELGDLADLSNLLEGAPANGQVSRGEQGEFDALSNVAAPDGHDEDSILSELRALDEAPDLVRDAELLFRFLDHRGFLPDGLEEVAEVSGVPLARLQAALARIRDIAHPAIGACDLRECFLLQLDALPEEHYVARKILVDYFDDLLANRIPQIAKAEDLSLDEVRHAIEVLALFDSRPLHEFDEDQTQAIMPDVLMTELADSSYAVSLIRDGLPEVRLTAKAREALDQAKGDKRLHAFLMKKIERARWFLDAVQQRRETLLRISRELARRQAAYLSYGPERMQPLKMQDVADEVGVHLSTVSRAIRGKHAQTPQGIVPLKGFFSGGQRSSRGGARSRVAIQERIREIIGAEDKAHPLSDEEVVTILRERDGTRVARRTVTKYRQALDIPSSTMRRTH